MLSQTEVKRLAQVAIGLGALPISGLISSGISGICAAQITLLFRFALFVFPERKLELSIINYRSFQVLTIATNERWLNESFH